MRFSVEDDGHVEIAMTPLIDCVFLLLIFFLVATVMKKVEKELPVELPQSAAAMKTPQTDQILVIGIDASGAYYLGSAPVTIEALHARLREAGKESPGQRVRIDGDQAAPFQSFVHIMDLCQFEGLTNVGIHTRAESKK